MKFATFFTGIALATTFSCHQKSSSDMEKQQLEVLQSKIENNKALKVNSRESTNTTS